MGVKENVLYRRMLLQQNRALRIPPPTNKDKSKVENAIKMLSAIACLNSFFYDLEEELSEFGLFKHGLKRLITQQHEVVKSVHELAYCIMNHENQWAGREYNDKFFTCQERISESVLLQSPEKSYNIVVSLCRIIKKLNEDVRGWYDFAPAECLYEIPRKIKTDKIKDYNIDLIVEKAL